MDEALSPGAPQSWGERLADWAAALNVEDVRLRLVPTDRVRSHAACANRRAALNVHGMQSAET